MLRIAVDMLFGDKVKYLMLVSAITFSTMLMIQQAGVFWGVMRSTTTTLRNTNAPIWVVDPNVEDVNLPKEMRDIELEHVKAVPGVAWAVPLFETQLLAVLYNGSYKLVTFVGVDTTTLLGVPPHMIKGRLEDLRKTNAVIIDENGIEKLSNTLNKPLEIGDVFTINDHEVRIVGIVKSAVSFFGYPLIYTTYERAIEIAPEVRRTLSFILVGPKPNVKVDSLAREIEKRTGLHAFTSDEFFWSTISWFFRNTGIPISFGLTILVGFIIGLAVVGQTFYSFVNENRGNFGALKVMGVENALLQRMLFVQASIVGLIGYGIGLFISVIVGLIIDVSGIAPFYMNWQICLIVFALVCIISVSTAYLGIRKINKLQPDEVFRD